MNFGKKNMVYSFLWQYGERLCSQGLAFITTVILARLLSPNEYGVTSIAMVSIALLEVFVTSGLGNALVQKKKIRSIDYSSVFWFNLFFSFLIYIILFILAPFIAEWFEINLLENVIRWMSIRVVFASFNSIQYAFVQREMMFKKIFYAGLYGNIISAVLGLSMAYSGWGVYALVVQYLSNTIINTIALFCIIPWRPHFEYSKDSLISLLSYGWKIFVAGFINTLVVELKSVIISKKYSPVDLALYDKGKQIPSLVYDNINTSIGKVLFPVISQCQDDSHKVLILMRKSMTIMAFILFPLLWGLMGVAENLISFLLTEKWILSVPYLRIACLTFLFVLINTVFTNVINALGLSKIHLYIEVSCTILGVILLFCLMNRGTIYIAISVTLSSILSVLIRFYFIRKYLKYGIWCLIEDIYKPLLISILMGSVVFFISKIKLPLVFILLCQILIGIIIYIVFSLFFMKNQFYFIKNLIKN